MYSGVHCHVIQDTARSCIAGHPVFQTTTGGTVIQLQSGLHLYYFVRRFTKFCGKRTEFQDLLTYVTFARIFAKKVKYFLLTGLPVKYGRVFLVHCPVQCTRLKLRVHWTRHFTWPCLTGHPVLRLCLHQS